MADYQFETIWQLRAPLAKVYEVIHDGDNYPLWWKGQEKVVPVVKGNELGIGAVKRFTTRGLLPYSLTFSSRVTVVEPMQRIEGTAFGELDGHGTWLLSESNGITTVKYIWVVRTTTFFMNLLAPLLRPLFSWNHHAVMDWGAEGLAKHLNCELVSKSNTDIR